MPLQGSLIRLKSTRCFYRPAPAPTGKRGAPRKRGAKLQPSDPASPFDPSGEENTLDHSDKPAGDRSGDIASTDMDLEAGGVEGLVTSVFGDEMLSDPAACHVS